MTSKSNRTNEAEADAVGSGLPADDAARQRQLAAAQQITHIGSWEWDVRTNAVTWSDELYRIYGLAPRSQAITFEWFLSRLHPEDRDRVSAQVGGALASGGPFAYPERIVRPDGSVRELETIGEVVHGDGSAVTGLIGTCRDVTEQRRREDMIRRVRERAQHLQALERRVLELVAAGATLAVVLGAVVSGIEELLPGTLASVLLLDETGTRLCAGAAPSLPAAYNAAIDGAPIGPKAGSCGTAAFRKEAVFVTDIETDPLWADYRDLARPYGLRACWSTPIFASDGRVLGTFALYYREPRAPDDDARELIARVTHVAGLAIERRQLDDQLRALSGHVEAAREQERTGIAREIHDELGQLLTALKMDLAWTGKRLVEPTPASIAVAREKLVEMARMTDDLVQVVRRISSELRPGVLDDLGLAAAVEWKAEEVAKQTGLTFSVRAELGELHASRYLSTAVFRIFQESVTNIVRHAEAAHVDVVLEVQGGALRLSVSDDGVGIPSLAATSPKALGLLGMRERARRLGGEASVASRAPRGTTVTVSIPLAGAAVAP